jgi:hypothetical protein
VPVGGGNVWAEAATGPATSATASSEESENERMTHSLQSTSLNAVWEEAAFQPSSV